MEVPNLLCTMVHPYATLTNKIVSMLPLVDRYACVLTVCGGVCRRSGGHLPTIDTGTGSSSGMWIGCPIGNSTRMGRVEERPIDRRERMRVTRVYGITGGIEGG